MSRHPLALGLLSALLSHAIAAEPIWIEAESTSTASAAALAGPGARPELLSGGRWLSLTAEKDAAPADGVSLDYAVDVATAGSYAVWARVGFEWVRADLALRVDGGEWLAMPATHQTTDVVELGVWNEVAWDAGPTLTLAAGRHALQVRLTRPEANDRFIFGLDCLALVPDGQAWRPDGVLKPGENYAADIDRRAEAVLHRIPAAPPGPRAEVPLGELWQVARYDDPDMDAQTEEPTTALPTDLRWRGIAVPSDAWSERPELSFAHRLAYRTRIEVPAALAGRSFLLRFGGHAWITSVFVNGRFVDGRTSTILPMEFDLSRAVVAGQVNTIEVVIKGAYYAVDHQPGELDRTRNQPRNEGFLKYLKWVDCTYPTGKGGADALHTGLARPATLVVAGRAYTSDVFVRTSVKDMRLDADVEVTNPGDEPLAVTLRGEAVDDRSGAVAKTFAAKTLSVPAHGNATTALAEAWKEATLWWPAESIDDLPTCYRLRTTLEVDGTPIDVRETLFGFRELGVDGRHVTVNGVRWRPHAWNSLGDVAAPDAMREYFRWNDRGVRMNGGEHVAFYDRHGIPGRMNSAWEGMFANVALENPRMWEHWKRHIAQQVKAYRNSPSVWHWQVGNEVQMITSRLAFSDRIGKHERQLAEVIAVAKQYDPTRLASEDGAGDLGGLGEVNNWHYVTAEYTAPRRFYEFTLGPASAQREGVDFQTLYRWDGKRPLLMGEEYYFDGMGNFAWFGGPTVYRGKEQRDAAGGKYGRMFTEGGRWQDVFLMNPCTGPLPGIATSMAAQAVFVREYDSAFAPGATVARTIKVFNDTRSDATLTLRWRVELGGKAVDQGEKAYALKAGLNQEDAITLRLPQAADRLDGKLVLELFAGERRVFTDSKPIAVLPPAPVASFAAETLAVFDPAGAVAAWLRQRQQAMTVVADLAALPAGAKTVLVGPGAVTADNHEAVAAALRRFVSAGNTAIVLEQAIPLREDDLPVPGIVVADKEKGAAARPEWEKVGGHSGAICHPMAASHPVLARLAPDDFFTWSGADQLSYRLSHATPQSGSINLVQAGEDLTLAPLFELLVGRGSYLISQLLVGEKLGRAAAADRLLTNALTWAAARGTAKATKTVVVGGDDALAAYVADAGIAHERVADVAAALAAAPTVAVIPATPANLQALSAQRAAVDALAARGGWIMLCGLDDAGLAAFNALVGFEHRLRPYRKEATLIEAADDPLAMGLSDRDVQQIDPEVIMPWTGTHRVSGKLFTNVVDATDEIASFAGFGPFKEGSDAPLVDGLTGQTFWRYTQYLAADGSEPVVATFDRAEVITAIELWQSEAYLWAKDIEVLLDGKPAARATLKAAIGWQTVALPPTSAKQVTIRLLSIHPPAKPVGNQLVTVDELRIRRQVPADLAQRVVPLTSTGGLVKYPRAKGGILLNQIRHDGDDLPENLAKKKLLFSALLRNLGATFTH